MRCEVGAAGRSVRHTGFAYEWDGLCTWEGALPGMGQQAARKATQLSQSAADAAAAAAAANAEIERATAAQLHEQEMAAALAEASHRHAEERVAMEEEFAAPLVEKYLAGLL